MNEATPRGGTKGCRRIRQRKPVGRTFSRPWGQRADFRGRRTTPEVGRIWCRRKAIEKIQRGVVARLSPTSTRWSKPATWQMRRAKSRRWVGGEAPANTARGEVPQVGEAKTAEYSQSDVVTGCWGKARHSAERMETASERFAVGKSVRPENQFARKTLRASPWNGKWEKEAC